MIRFLPLLFVALLGPYSCADEGRESEIDPSEVVETTPDYEDSNPSGDSITYTDQSARDSITTQTTNYAKAADDGLDTLVKPTYTDNEYEAAFSTSTTNPKNQVEGGVTPGNQQKRKKN